MKKWMRYAILTMISFVLWSFAFKTSYKYEVPYALKVKKPVQVLFPKNEITCKTITVIIPPPFTGRAFIGFKEALAFKESRGNYFITNTLGYLGKYQFGIGTLQLMGVYSATSFLNDPVLQERVFVTNIARNKWILRRDIKRFKGKRIRGIMITESGLMAAAHLAGAGNVKKYLRSDGKIDPSDAYGTTLSMYLENYAGYDISYVAAKHNPKL